jgi:hypothetical protein
LALMGGFAYPLIRGICKSRCTWDTWLERLVLT